jgi:hypothetical protein
MNKKIYVGGGFLESQLIWILPIINSYCKKNNVKSIIFENKLSNRFTKNRRINRYLINYKIEYLKENFILKNFYKIFFFFILNLFSIFYFSIILKKETLLNKKNSWKNSQIFHSIWDTSFLYLRNNEIKPKIFYKIKSSIKVFYNIFLANLLIKQNIVVCFMAHTVYAHRAMIATLRNHKIKIICHANSCLYLLNQTEDNSWNTPNKKFLELFKNFFFYKEAEKYWKNRLKGRSTYDDAKIAFAKNTKIENNYVFPKNIIMLHVFRDSPFNIIDRTRVFSDYIDWIRSTLKIIKDSNEEWLIRPHPSYKKWGEDSSKIFNAIYSDVFNRKKPNNIKFSTEQFPNLELLKKAKRIVTFSGTVHLESACFGIRPIVISKCTLSNINNKLVLKPKNIKEYSKLLLEDSNFKIFKLDNPSIKESKLLLFIREKILSLKNDLNTLTLFRNDKKYLFDRDFKNVLKSLEKNENFLVSIGELIDNKLNCTISKKYYKILI